eukprot:698261-Prorocentrum_minimum.AAC.1
MIGSEGTLCFSEYYDYDFSREDSRRGLIAGPRRGDPSFVDGYKLVRLGPTNACGPSDHTEIQPWTGPCGPFTGLGPCALAPGNTRNDCSCALVL